MNKKTAYFLVFTYLISGLGWGSLLILTREGLLEFGQPLFMIPFILAGFGPTIAPFIAIALTEGRPGIKAYSQRLFKFKIPFLYYLFPLISLLFLGLVSAVVNRSLSPRLMTLTQNPPMILLGFFIQSFIFGGLEELGWRGLLQHELQQKQQIGFTYLVVWLSWAVWHLPLFFIPGVSQFGKNFWVFALYALFFTLIFGWAYGRTRSIPLAVLGHTLVNTLSAVGYLNFLNRGFIRWSTLLIIMAALISLHIFFPVNPPSDQST